MTPAGIEFGKRVLTPERVAGRDVLDVGSYDTTGEGTGNEFQCSLRPDVEALRPKSYVGLDVRPGPGVDVVGDALEIVDRFGSESFDVVISTDTLEHIRDWRSAVRQMKAVLRPGGLLLLELPDIGFPFHYGPFDFWRYSAADLRAILADMTITALEEEPSVPSVYVFARNDRMETIDLDGIRLHSVIAGRRVRDIHRLDELAFIARSPRRIAHALLPQRAKNVLWRVMPAGLRGRLGN